MIKLFNLLVIETIFKNHNRFPMSAQEKMVYINCLTHHFKNLEASYVNAQQFTLKYSENPILNDFKDVFKILEKNGLVYITDAGIIFEKVWEHLNLITSNSFVQQINAIDLAEQNNLKQHLLDNDFMRELCGIKHKVVGSAYDKLVELFLIEQIATNKKYSSLADSVKHFMFWIPRNVNAVYVDKKKPKILGE